MPALSIARPQPSEHASNAWPLAFRSSRPIGGCWATDGIRIDGVHSATADSSTKSHGCTPSWSLQSLCMLPGRTAALSNWPGLARERRTPITGRSSEMPTGFPRGFFSRRRSILSESASPAPRSSKLHQRLVRLRYDCGRWGSQPCTILMVPVVFRPFNFSKNGGSLDSG